MLKKIGFTKRNLRRQATGSRDRLNDEILTATDEHDRSLTERTQGKAREGERRKSSTSGEIGLTPKSCVLLANKYRTNGETKDAIRFYKKTLEFSQNQNEICRTEALIGLGHVYRDLGKKEKSISYYKEAKPLARSGSSRKQLSEVYLGIAEAYENNEEYEPAIKNYKKSRETAEKHDYWQVKKEACLGLERTFKKIGDPETAKQYSTEASNTGRSSFMRKPEFFLDMADRYKRNFEIHKAIKAYEKAVQSAEGDHNMFKKMLAYLGMGDCFKILRQIEKAREYFEKAEKTVEKQWDILSAILKIMNTFTLSDIGADNQLLEKFYHQHTTSSIDGM